MITSRAIARALVELVAKDGVDPNTAVARTTGFLARHNLTALLPTVLSYAQKSATYERERDTLSIRSAHEVSDELKDSIARLTESAPDTPAEVVVDAELIGGFVARVRNVLYDASVRTQLIRLKNTLSRGDTN